MNLAHRVNLFKVTRSENLEDQIFRTEIYNFVINLLGNFFTERKFLSKEEISERYINSAANLEGSKWLKVLPSNQAINIA